MRVMIAGGTGFIGRMLSRALQAAGDQVVILSRFPKGSTSLEGAEVLQWDARTAQGWGKRVDEVDAVVNVVGENIGGGRWTARRKERILNSRVFAGQALTEAIQQARHRPSVLVQMSGIGHYGFTGDQLLDERSPAGRDFLAQVTVAWEDSTRPVEELGVRRVVLRNAVVLDKKDGIFPLVLLPFRFMVGGPVGSGKQWFPWIHRDDDIQALIYLMKEPSASGSYNLTAPEQVTYAQMGQVIARAMSRPYWAPVPAFAMKAVLGEMSSLVLEGQRAAPSRLLEAGYKFRFPTLDGALRDLFR